MQCDAPEKKKNLISTLISLALSLIRDKDKSFSFQFI